MSRKYKATHIVVHDREFKHEYRTAHVLQILRAGIHGVWESFWWTLMQETFSTAYQTRDKKLFDEARKILDREVWNTYFFGMLYDPKIHKNHGK